MKVKLFIFILVGLLLGAVYSVPYFIDWDSKKDQLVKDILQDTGLDVAITGKVAVTSFPTLKLSVTGVTISTNVGQDKISLFTANSASVNFKVLDLIRGKVTLSNLVFEKGILNFDSRVPGDVFKKIANINIGGTNGASSLQLTSFTLNILGAEYKNKIANINANIGIGSKLDSLTIDGSYVQNNDIINIQLIAGGKDQTLNLKLFKENGFSLAYQGTFGGDLANISSKGMVNVKLTKLSDGGIFLDNPLPFLGYLSSDLIKGNNINISGDAEIVNGDFNSNNLKIVSPIVNGTVSYRYTTSEKKIFSSVILNLTDLNLVGLEIDQPNNRAVTNVSTIGPVALNEPGSSHNLFVSKYIGHKFFDLSLVSKINSSLSITIGTVKYNNGTINNVALDGAITDGEFKLHNLNLNLSDDIKLSVTNVSSQVIDNANVLVGNVLYSGKDLAGQLSLTNIPKYLYVKPNTSFSFSSQVILAENELTLLGIDAVIDKGQVTGRWTVQTHNPSDNKYDIDLTFNNLNMNDFKAEQFSQLVQNLFNNSNQKNYYANFVPLREIDTNALVRLNFLNCNLGDSVINRFYSEVSVAPAKLNFKHSVIDAPFANLKGDVQIISNSLRPNITVNLTGDLFDADMANSTLFGINESSAASADPATSTDKVNIAATIIPADGSKASIGNTVPNTVAKDGAQADSAASTTPTAASTVEGVSAIPVPNISNVKPYWSQDSFKYFRIDKFDGILNIKLAKFVYGGVELDNLNLESTLRENVWYINYLKAGLFGGDLLAKGDIDRREEQAEISLSAALNNFDLSTVKIGSDSLQDVKGKASVSGSFHMIGKSPYDFMSAMNSSINFAIRDMTIKGMDINRIILIAAQLESDVDKNDVMDQIDLAYKNGTTNFIAIDGQLTTKAGILQTKNVTLKTANSNGYLSSSVDMRYFISNSLIEFNFMPKASKLLNLKFQILGPYTKLLKAVDDKDLMNYIRQEYGLIVPQKAVPAKQQSTQFIYQKVIQ